MFETNRNGRPIQTQANIKIVMDMHNCQFEFVQGAIVPSMRIGDDVFYDRGFIVRFIWERCLALDFMAQGLEKAVRTAVWEQLGLCWEKKGAQDNQSA